MTRGATVEQLDADPVETRAPRRNRPGWAYAANLVPPEFVTSFRLRRLRQSILLGVCVAVLLSAVGFAYGFWRVHQADVSLQAARQQGTTLQKESGRYGQVIEIQAGATRVREELGTLLAGDVDVAGLIGKIRAAAPKDVQLDAVTVTIPAGSTASTASTAEAAKAAAGAPSAPDASGSSAPAQRIGTVELDASGQTIVDASAYADALGRIAGVLDVLPTSNSAQGGATQFSLTFTLTDALLTHRFAAEPAGGQR